MLLTRSTARGDHRIRKNKTYHGQNVVKLVKVLRSDSLSMMRDLNTILLTDLNRAAIRARSNVEARCAERINFIKLVLDPQSLDSVLENGPIEIVKKKCIEREGF